MRRILILGLLALPLPATAQTPTEEGLGLVERGLGIIAENLWSELGPQLGDALTDLAPMARDLSALVDDLGNYHAPERLENGDILIRRRADAPPPPALGGRPGDAPAEPSVPVDPDQPEIPL
mgnify:CR=1 FL=1